MHLRVRKLNATTVYFIRRAVWSFCFTLIYTAMPVYRIQVLGMDALQLVLVGTVLEVSSLIFEIPTGVVADIYSRRLSIILGMFCLGAAAVVQGAIPLVWVMLVAEVLHGLGWSFGSGADQAWIAGEVGEERVGHVFLRATQVGRVGGLMGMGVSGAIGMVRVELPILVGGVLTLLLGVFLALTMPETGFRPLPRVASRWSEMSATLRRGLMSVQHQPVLMAFGAIEAVQGASSEAYDRLWGAHILQNHTLPLDLAPVAWFGVVNAGSMLLTIAAVEVARRRIHVPQPHFAARLLLRLTAVQVVALGAFAWTNSFWSAVAAMWAVGRGTGRRRTGPKRHACTGFSVRGQSDCPVSPESV